MVADLSLVEAMASFLHVAFVWNQEEGEAVAVWLQRKVARIDESCT